MGKKRLGQVIKNGYQCIIGLDFISDGDLISVAAILAGGGDHWLADPPHSEDEE